MSLYGSYLRPGVRPLGRVILPDIVYDLDFKSMANNAELSAALAAAGFAYTRTGGAWYYDGSLWQQAAQDVPRLHTEGSYKGLLIEGARTNLILQSQAWASSPWNSLLGATAANADGVGPDGTNSLSRFTASSQFSVRYQSFTSVDGTTYTGSFWVKNIDGNTALHMFHESSATATYASITLTSTLQRLSKQFLGRAGGGAISFGLQDRNSAGFGSAHVWQAQVESAAFPSTPIPTAGSAVTRNADSCIKTLSGASQEGAVYLDFLLPPGLSTLNDGLYTAHDGTEASKLTVFRDTSGNLRFYSGTGGSLTPSQPAFQALSRRKLALSCFADGSVRACINAGPVIASAAGSLGSPATWVSEKLGTGITGMRNWFSPILQVRRYNRALSDTELQALTA